MRNSHRRSSAIAITGCARDITSANKENAGAAAAVLGNLNTHTGNDSIHVTAAEKMKWNNPGAVLYTPQGLTEEQKAQARTNIGADTVRGAVLYTPQNLTGEQKVQALQNISAAPGWYGLGSGSKYLSADDDLNNVWENGFYRWEGTPPKNAPDVNGTVIGYCSAIVLNRGGSYNAHQIVYTHEGYELYRSCEGTTIHPWVWVNPPMWLNYEFRTAEQYLGKPVYKQLMYLGTLGSGSIKTFYPFGENYSAGSYNVFSVEFHLSNFQTDGGWTMTLPYVDHTTQQTIVRAQFVGSRIEFYISTNELAKYHGFALMKYTKATD